MSAARLVSLTRDAWGRLVASLADGSRSVGVVPARCFPLSAAKEWISLRDEHGKELILLRTLDAVPADAQALIEEELRRGEFMPRILRILGIAPDSHPSIWRVETDRGACELTLPSEDHIQGLEPFGAILTDVHGVRYRVLDSRALDPHSRSLLARHL